MKSSFHQSIDIFSRLLGERQKESKAANGERTIFSNYFVFRENIFHFFQLFSDHDNSIKIDSSDEVGVDVDNDDDLPMMGDIDSGDHDSNDMSRPRKIRR